jgi:hypothetical protein
MGFLKYIIIIMGIVPPIDYHATRAKARAEVATLRVILDEVKPTKPKDTHLINIANKMALTATEFKQMFYARGDDHFCIANIYECPNNANSILASVWGKRQDNNPYNPCSRVVNFNKLGGRPNQPNGVDMAYGYSIDLQRNFYAQYEIMGNLERDLCVKRKSWSTCSRQKIEDQLYGLSFVPEQTSDLCLEVICARDWSEVENRLAESCLAEGKCINYGDMVDLFINIEIVNANPNTKPTTLRMRYTVQLVRGPDDLGDWNVRARDSAKGVMSSGIKFDTPEGGYRQAANASNTNYKMPPPSHPNYPRTATSNPPYYPPPPPYAAPPPQYMPPYPPGPGYPPNGPYPNK